MAATPAIALPRGNHLISAQLRQENGQQPSVQYDFVVEQVSLTCNRLQASLDTALHELFSLNDAWTGEVAESLELVSWVFKRHDPRAVQGCGQIWHHVLFTSFHQVRVWYPVKSFWGSLSKMMSCVFSTANSRVVWVTRFQKWGHTFVFDVWLMFHCSRNYTNKERIKALSLSAANMRQASVELKMPKLQDIARPSALLNRWEVFC